MRWTEKLSNNIKRTLQSWLDVQPSNAMNISIRETMDFEANAIRNRIWYRGDSNELEQLYMNDNVEYADRYKFWSCKCSPGMEIRKIHTGIPGLVVRVLSSIVLTDMNDFEFDIDQQARLWEEISKDNNFIKKMESALKEILYIGDGAFKVTIDTEVSQYPILEWYPGERVEIIYHRDRVSEVIFKTPYKIGGKKYVLNERYGKGYIINELYDKDKKVEISSVETLKSVSDYTFDESIMLAVPFKVFESAKYEGRGGSIYDGKIDSFDAFDEVWSQWMDALRAGRAKTYIPESLLPRNPFDGLALKPNSFDNRFIRTDSDMSENAKNQINTEQPAIPHDSYQASYSTALDLCLQGIISPSTLGIDVKKLDNADAQREKEKATLYTRNAIVEALQGTLPEVVSACINAHNILNGRTIEEVKVNIPFENMQIHLLNLR